MVATPAWVRRSPLRRPVGFLLALLQEVGQDRVMGIAAEVAFFGMLSVFPALLVFATALGSLSRVAGQDVAANVENEVISKLQLLFTSQASGAVDAVQQLFERQQGGLLTAGVVAALVSVSGAFAAIVSALNIAYDIPETRSWFRRRLLGLLMGLGSVLLFSIVLTIVVVGPLLGKGDGIFGLVGLSRAATDVWSWARWPVMFAVAALWATTLCHLSPARRTPWKYDLAGGLLTAVLWLVVSAGFNVYLRVAAQGNPLLGVLGGGLILMTWLYLMSLALLIGGEVNALLTRGAEERTAREQGAGSVRVATTPSPVTSHSDAVGDRSQRADVRPDAAG